MCFCRSSTTSAVPLAGSLSLAASSLRFWTIALAASANPVKLIQGKGFAGGDEGRGVSEKDRQAFGPGVHQGFANLGIVERLHDETAGHPVGRLADGLRSSGALMGDSSSGFVAAEPALLDPAVAAEELNEPEPIHAGGLREEQFDQPGPGLRRDRQSRRS